MLRVLKPICNKKKKKTITCVNYIVYHTYYNNIIFYTVEEFTRMSFFVIQFQYSFTSPCEQRLHYTLLLVWFDGGLSVVNHMLLP